MRGASSFSESLLHGACMEQAGSLGQLSHTVQWELEQSLLSLWEKKKKKILFALRIFISEQNKYNLGKCSPSSPTAECVPMPFTC